MCLLLWPWLTVSEFRMCAITSNTAAIEDTLRASWIRVHSKFYLRNNTEIERNKCEFIQYITDSCAWKIQQNTRNKSTRNGNINIQCHNKRCDMILFNYIFTKKEDEHLLCEPIYRKEPHCENSAMIYSMKVKCTIIGTWKICWGITKTIFVEFLIRLNRRYCLGHLSFHWTYIIDGIRIHLSHLHNSTSNKK